MELRLTNSNDTRRGVKDGIKTFIDTDTLVELFQQGPVNQQDTR